MAIYARDLSHSIEVVYFIYLFIYLHYLISIKLSWPE